MCLKISFPLLIALFFPLRPSLIHPEENVPRMRGVQIHFLETASWKEIEKLWDSFKASGVNTVILRVYRNPGDRSLFLDRSEQISSGVYFNTNYAPVIKDWLRPLIRLSHAKGLKIFAWMTTRNCLWKVIQKPDLKEYIYDFTKDQIVPGKGLNIFDPRVQKYLKNLYCDLSNYPLDGILLQDDLILRHNEGYNSIARVLYKKEIGRSLLPQDMYQNIEINGEGRVFVTRYTSRFWQWTRWKEAYLRKFLRDLVSSIKSVNPKIRLAINLYYESVIRPKKALAWYAQNLASYRDIPLDYFVIMAYHRQMRKEMGLSKKKTWAILRDIPRLCLNQVHPPERVAIKLQIIDWETQSPLPEEEILQALNSLITYRRISLLLTPIHNHLPLILIPNYLDQ
jgi:biofilm PGA synthesis lipoprotein PgaB